MGRGGWIFPTPPIPRILACMDDTFVFIIQSISRAHGSGISAVWRGSTDQNGGSQYCDVKTLQYGKFINFDFQTRSVAVVDVTRQPRHLRGQAYDYEYYRLQLRCSYAVCLSNSIFPRSVSSVPRSMDLLKWLLAFMPANSDVDLALSLET